MPEDQDDLTPAERSALGSLPRVEAPPPWLEDRVVHELKARGFIRSAATARRYAIIAGALAASLAFLALGLALGSRWNRAASPPSPSGHRFVLFLYESGDYEAPAPAEAAGRVEEYRSWARALRDRGALIAGEKLKEGGMVLAGAAPTASESAGPAEEEGVLAGYFVVSARDADQALAIARSCPHLKHRGRIEVREIDPV